jgi:hypothetical protein
MRKILIATLSGDAHGIAVSHALTERGIQNVRWLGNELPSLQHVWCNPVQHNHTDFSFVDGRASFDVDDDTTIWLRRIGYPIIPDDGALFPDDVKFAASEARTFTESWLHMLSRGYCVNSFHAKLKANSKLLQLKIASEVGMKVPHTVIGNCPDSIHRIFTINREAKWLYKPFKVHQWDSADSTRVTHAAGITPEVLPGNTVLSRVPGIYQEVIRNKVFEVRANFFGDYCVAAKIAKLPQDKIDWRSVEPEALGIEPIDIPEQVSRQCRDVMRRLGLEFGAFDLVVDADSRYWFLEVNESGQFLWIERANPEIPLLDVFCEFLIHGQPKFIYRSTSPKSSYQRLVKSGIIAEQMKEIETAVREPSANTYRECVV